MLLAMLLAATDIARTWNPKPRIGDMELKCNKALYIFEMSDRR